MVGLDRNQRPAGRRGGGRLQRFVAGRAVDQDEVVVACDYGQELGEDKPCSSSVFAGAAAECGGGCVEMVPADKNVKARSNINSRCEWTTKGQTGGKGVTRVVDGSAGVAEVLGEVALWIHVDK